MKACRVGGAESMRLPFDCPMDHVLDTPRFFESAPLGVTVREAAFLSNPRVPANVSGSIARAVPIDKGLSDEGVRRALKAHESAAIIELKDVTDVFCGFESRSLDAEFKSATQRVLDYKRSPLCYEDGTRPDGTPAAAPPYSQCCHPRKPGDKFFPCVHGFDDPEPLVACKS